jgi:hypothetical protein
MNDEDKLKLKEIRAKIDKVESLYREAIDDLLNDMGMPPSNKFFRNDYETFKFYVNKFQCLDMAFNKLKSDADAISRANLLSSKPKLYSMMCDAYYKHADKMNKLTNNGGDANAVYAQDSLNVGNSQEKETYIFRSDFCEWCANKVFPGLILKVLTSCGHHYNVDKAIPTECPFCKRKVVGSELSEANNPLSHNEESSL